MTMHERIKLLREEQRISRAELARLVGYTSRSSINKVEAGLVDLPQSKIAAFAKALNTTPRYLMGWEEQPAPQDGLSPAKRKLISRVQQMTDAQAEAFLQAMDAFLSIE